MRTEVSLSFFREKAEVSNLYATHALHPQDKFVLSPLLRWSGMFGVLSLRMVRLPQLTQGIVWWLDLWKLRKIAQVQ